MKAVSVSVEGISQTYDLLMILMALPAVNRNCPISLMTLIQPQQDMGRKKEMETCEHL